MAQLPSKGQGKFGLHIEYDYGDTQNIWFKYSRDRNEEYRLRKGAPGIKSIKKTTR